MAQPLYERALRMCEALYSADKYPDLAASIKSVAFLLNARGSTPRLNRYTSGR